MKIISGGQTGVDRAALDAALELGLSCGGWCPKGRKAEDGPLLPRYPLEETDSDDYSVRTEWNVRDSDGTLIITRGKPTGGTAFTIVMARVHRKPCLVIDIGDNEGPLSNEHRNDANVVRIRQWLKDHDIHTLNIAGPRESGMPGIYDEARLLLSSLLGHDFS